MDSGWNQPALVNVCYNGFSDLVKDQLLYADLPVELDSCIMLAYEIDHLSMKVAVTALISSAFQ